MKFHVILEANNSHLEIARLAQLAESYGMAGIWTSNMHDTRDPFINFVEAARVTKTIKLGPVAVSPYELHPLKMANALLTLNEISGGRAHIGVGVGAGQAGDLQGWHVRSHVLPLVVGHATATRRLRVCGRPADDRLQRPLCAGHFCRRSPAATCRANQQDHTGGAGQRRAEG